MLSLLLGCASRGDVGDNNLIWIIPVAIVAGLLVLGLIILLIIKLFLLILVSCLQLTANGTALVFRIMWK